MPLATESESGQYRKGTEGQLIMTSDKTVRHTHPADLDEAQCWDLLGSAELCRLAFLGEDDHPDIRPVNYFVVKREIYIRTAFDSKFLAVAANSHVALEVDGEDDASYWSVVVRGEAAQVTSEGELHRVGAQHFESWTATPKQFVLKVSSESVTGRRFPKFPRFSPPVYAVPLTAGATAEHREQRAERPSPIPHFEPSSPD